MKMYPKRLSSAEDLKREKKALKVAIAYSNEEGFFGGSSSSNKKKKKDKGKKTRVADEDILAGITDLFDVKDITGLLFSLGGPIMQYLGWKAEKNILKSVAKEVFGGYIKWKLIEISYKTALRFIRSKQHKTS